MLFIVKNDSFLSSFLSFCFLLVETDWSVSIILLTFLLSKKKHLCNLFCCLLSFCWNRLRCVIHSSWFLSLVQDSCLSSFVLFAFCLSGKTHFCHLFSCLLSFWQKRLSVLHSVRSHIVTFSLSKRTNLSRSLIPFPFSLSNKTRFCFLVCLLTGHAFPPSWNEFLMIPRLLFPLLLLFALLPRTNTECMISSLCSLVTEKGLFPSYNLSFFSYTHTHTFVRHLFLFFVSQHIQTLISVMCFVLFLNTYKHLCPDSFCLILEVRNFLVPLLFSWVS